MFTLILYFSCDLAWNKGGKAVPSYWIGHHCLWFYLVTRNKRKPSLCWRGKFPGTLKIDLKNNSDEMLFSPWPLYKGDGGGRWIIRVPGLPAAALETPTLEAELRQCKARGRCGQNCLPRAAQKTRRRKKRRRRKIGEGEPAEAADSLILLAATHSALLSPVWAPIRNVPELVQRCLSASSLQQESCSLFQACTQTAEHKSEGGFKSCDSAAQTVKPHCIKIFLKLDTAIRHRTEWCFLPDAWLTCPLSDSGKISWKVAIPISMSIYLLLLFRSIYCSFSTTSNLC